MFNPSATASAVERDGFAVVEGVLDYPSVDGLIASLARVSDNGSVRKRDGTFAMRNLLEVAPAAYDLAHSEAVRALVKPVLGRDFFPVRGILFDKIPGANWKVPWHQDVTIAVKNHVEAEGYGPWSIKAGVHHVQPPAQVLQGMVSVRLHLDDCTANNGALRVIPGSHQYGRIAEECISTMLATSEVICTVGAGGVLLMRPLLLHASSPSRVPVHRRVIHMDFASSNLPSGMNWYSEAAHPMSTFRLQPTT